MDSNSEPSVSSLVNSAITDAQSLMRQQIELAKSEVAQSAKQAAGASGLLIGAAVLAFLAFVFGLVAGAYGIVAAGLPVWAGFLIVAGVLLLVGIILGLVGKSRVKYVTPPQRAISQAEKTKASLSGLGANRPLAGVDLEPVTDSAVAVPTP
jgi:Putative Actinobacterial Holin-X, holin superfamily III